MLGNVAQPGYRYARRFDDATSWLIDQDPSVPATSADWLVRDIVDLKADGVRAVTIVHPDGERIRVSKESEAQTDFDVVDMPADRELSYPTVANGIAGVLNALSFDDVRASSDVPADDIVITTFETFAGDVITVTSREEDGNYWIALSATAGETEEGVESVAAGIAARSRGWEYQVAGYKANQLTRRWEDILKALPEDEDDSE